MNSTTGKSKRILKERRPNMREELTISEKS